MNRFLVRYGTADWNIYRSISEFNEYRLPDKFNPDDIIIDIGGHIGSFSYECYKRGCRNINVFEAWEENYNMLKLNLLYPGIKIVNKAVWRSDLPFNPDLFFQQSTDSINTGGGNVLFNSTGIKVETISLDEILSAYDKVRLIKLDCEGSEFPILFTSKQLYKVEEIVGEYHEIGGEYNKVNIPENCQIDRYSQFTIKELELFLNQNGFTVEHFRYPNSNLGMFFAKRK
jgi:FkbM family methyltransferase